MPFSFIEIEERKTKIIIFLFLFLILFYFFSAWILTLTVRILFLGRFLTSSRRLFSLSFNHLAVIFLISLIIGVSHWFISVSNTTEKILTLLGARPPDKEDTYHKRLINIIDEVSIALGGRKIDCVVLPVFGMNAFSIADFRNRAVIGVTEGLLSRLSRPQLEAVVAHEAAHIVSKDTLVKTIAVAIFSIYAAILDKLKSGMEGTTSSRYGNRGGGISVYIVIVYLVTAILHGLGKLISMFISRRM